MRDLVRQFDSTLSIARRHLIFASLLLVAIALWMDSLARLLQLSAQKAENTHALLVIPISIALLWFNRKEIFRNVSFGGLPAVTLLAIGVAAWLALNAFEPSLGTENRLSISILSLVVFSIGAFALAYGTQAMAAAQFPLLMSVFIVPIPSYVVAWITFALQYGSTIAVDWFLHITGVPFHREGFVILLPVRSIQIAEQCSGIRAAIILLIVSMVIAYLYLRTTICRALLVLMSIPISIIKNGLRILTLSLLANYSNPNILDSEFHRHSGMVFFAVSIGGLFLATVVLKWLENKTLGRSTSRHGGDDHSPARAQGILPQRQDPA